MLLEDVDVIGARVERRQAGGGAGPTIVAMVVVGANHRAVRLAQNLGDAHRQRRLPRRRITYDAEYDRMIDSLRHIALQALLPKPGFKRRRARRCSPCARSACRSSRSAVRRLLPLSSWSAPYNGTWS